MYDDAYIGGRSENNIKCVVHDSLGWKTEQLDIFCKNYKGDDSTAQSGLSSQSLGK